MDIYSGRSLFLAMLAVVFGIGMAVLSWRAMRSGEGQYDVESTQQAGIFNVIGIIAGLALAYWGGWVLWHVVPEWVLW
jgi:uncharacterized membrane protein